MLGARKGLLALGAAAGAVAGSALPLMAGASTKRFALGAVALVGAPVFLGVRDKERFSLAALLILATIKIDYYVLGLYSPHSGGAEGLYVKPSDIPLALLYALWLIDAATGRPERARRSTTMFGLFVPFVVVGLATVAVAANSSWAAYEWVRWLRAGLLLFYVARRLRPSDAEFGLKALAVAVMAQSALGLLQTGLRRSFGLDKLGVIGEGSESVLAQDIGLDGSIVRSAGTLSHPNLLGAYLDLTLPVFLALALADRNPKRRLFWVGALALGTPALIGTLSRASWGAFALGCLACGVFLLWFRVIDARRWLTVTFVGASLALVALAPLSPVIAKRLTFNFGESLDFRDDMNRLAVRMFVDQPILGVGLNNFTVAFQEIEPSDAAKMEREWGTIAAVHNLYLLVLSETGALGLATFALFWCGFFAVAPREARKMDRWGRAATAGVMAGILAAMAGDLLAFALWQDSVNLTAIFMIGLTHPLTAFRDRREQGGA